MCDKIIRTTTDNGLNFVKAFRVYEEDENNNVAPEEVTEEATQDDGPDTEEMEAEVDFISVENIMAEDINDGLQYQVPKHHQCACHLLNLVSTVDANNANKTEAYKRLSRSAFSKSQALWNKISRSTTAAEVIEEHCKLQLVQPNATQWNSFYMAVSSKSSETRRGGHESCLCYTQYTHVSCKCLDVLLSILFQQNLIMLNLYNIFQ